MCGFIHYLDLRAGHEKGTIRHFVFFGGLPEYRSRLAGVAGAGYDGISFM